MPNIYFLIAFIFALTLIGYLLDPSSTQYATYIDNLGNTTATDPTELNSSPLMDFGALLLTWLFSWQGALTTGVVVGVALFSGGNLSVVVPFALVSILANLLIFPMGIFMALPAPIPGLFSVFWTLSIFIIAMSFVRSG